MVRLADVSGAVVSWNDFGMMTPEWEESLEFMEAQRAIGQPDLCVARCQRPETRFTLEEALGDLRRGRNWLEFYRRDKPESLPR